MNIPPGIPLGSFNGLALRLAARIAEIWPPATAPGQQAVILGQIASSLPPAK